MIEASALLVTRGKLQTLFTPETLDLLVVDSPAFGTEQPGNLAISIPPILLRQTDQGQAQRVVILGSSPVV